MSAASVTTELVCKNSCTETNNKSSLCAFTFLPRPTVALGWTLFGVSMELGRSAIIACCHQVFVNLWKQASQIDCCNLFQSACHITRPIVAPLSWALMSITSIKGEGFLCQYFPVNPPATIPSCKEPCENEEHTKKMVCANRKLRQKLHDHQHQQ